MNVETPSAHHVAVRNLVTHLVSHLRAGRNRDLLVGGALTLQTGVHILELKSVSPMRISHTDEVIAWRWGGVTTEAL